MRPAVEAVVAEDDYETDDDEEVSQLISGQTQNCKKVVTGGYYNLASIDEVKVFQFDVKWKEKSIEILDVKYNILYEYFSEFELNKSGAVLRLYSANDKSKFLSIQFLRDDKVRGKWRSSN